jgi:phosphoribosylformylglycinamidine synthase
MAAGDRLRATALLFGEAPSRIVLSVAPAHWDDLARLAAEHGVAITRLGTVDGDRFSLPGLIDQAVTELHALWRNGLAVALAGATEAEARDGTGPVV